MVKLIENKHTTEHLPIETLPICGCVTVPLSQHLGKICLSLVKPGETVLRGQKIAEVQAHVYAPIHAPVSGKVVSVQEAPHPVLGQCKAIIIESDGLDKSLTPNPCLPDRQAKTQEEIESLNPEQIRAQVFEAGIVGQGIELLRRCLGVQNVYIGIEDNKPEAIKKFKTLNSCLSDRQAEFKVRVLRSEYPQGGERQLIKNILGREVPSAKLPFDVGVVVHNVGTCFAVYEAIYKNKPLYERVVTVTGSCLSAPKNLWVRLGTPIKELIDFCGPVREEPAKIVMGGPMMGIAQYTLDVPVIKTTTGVVLFNGKEAKVFEEEFCIRCGACVRACPAGLMPCLINLASEKGKWIEAQAYSALDCIECGLCNYV